MQVQPHEADVVRHLDDVTAEGARGGGGGVLLILNDISPAEKLITELLHLEIQDLLPGHPSALVNI